MANRDGKLILRTLKNISASIEVDGGGGTKVVTELPEVGDEHTVYELHEQVPADFPWLLTEIDESKEYPTPNYLIIVVETLEDAQSMENPEHINVVFWVRSESKAYQCFVGKGGIWVEFADVDVVDNIYAGPLGDFAILKDFDYHVTMITGEQGYTILDGTGHFLDGTDFNYDDKSSVVPLVLTDATNKKYGLDDNNLIGVVDLTNTTKPIPEGDLITKIDLNLRNKEFTVFPVFVPQPAHTEVSYWIYANNQWVNMDKIGQISNTGAIFVEADSFADLTQEKFYGNGKELEVEFIETTPEGGEVSTGYAIIKRVPIDTPIELTVSIWPQNGISYNGQTFSQGDTVTVIGAGIIYLSFMAM